MGFTRRRNNTVETMKQQSLTTSAVVDDAPAGETVTFQAALGMYLPLPYKLKFARAPEWVVLEPQFMRDVVAGVEAFRWRGAAPTPDDDEEERSRSGFQAAIFGKGLVVGDPPREIMKLPLRLSAEEDATTAQKPPAPLARGHDSDQHQHCGAPALTMALILRDALLQYQSDEAFFGTAIRHTCRPHIAGNLHLIPPLERRKQGVITKILSHNYPVSWTT